jgi:hypothetical protein
LSSPDDLARQALDEVLEAAPQAILIGGWASWLRDSGPMSHDIDLIVDYAAMASIAAHATDLSQSGHIAGAMKWRGTWNGVHLDLYVPHQSRLGNHLKLRVEALGQHTEVVDGRRVLSVDAHIATKWAALLDRAGSQRGDKDRDEILELMKHPGAESTPDVLRHASALSPEAVELTIQRGFQILSASPNINRAQRQALRRVSIKWSATGRPVQPPRVSAPDQSIER